MRRSKVTIITIILISLVSCLQAATKYDRRSALVEAFDKTHMAVVNIASKETRAISSNTWDLFGGGDPMMPFHRPSTQSVQSLGSGFIIHPDGYIITNAHVVDQAEEITVLMASDRQYIAKKIISDPSADLAIIKIESATPLQAIEINYEKPLIGETVLAIGNPFNYSHTLTEGIVSAIHRNIEVSNNKIMPDLIQISAPINPGNSGGPLLDINGKLLGINTAVRTSAQGIGFAIPIEQMEKTLTKMLTPGKVKRIELGLKVARNSKDTNGNNTPGLLVNSLDIDSPCQIAGFQAGDIILKVNNKEVSDPIEFYLNILKKNPGDKIEFHVQRNWEKDNKKKMMDITVTLKQRAKPNGRTLSAKLFGLDVASLTTKMIRHNGILAEPGSVVITRIKRNSQAERIGIEPGDVIISVNGTTIKNAQTFGRALEVIDPGEETDIIIARSLYTRFGEGIIKHYRLTLKAAN